ncbi:MAG TPA: YDG domain-containing protein, partial [Nocardioides sp.]|nr:YDG domain-containing protein [Nocardioides sp.]
MSLTPLSRGRARRAASVVAATSLGFAALVAGTSAAHAAGDLSATLTPTSASPSTNTTFSYTFTSTGTGIGAVDLTLPAGYGAPSSLSIAGSEPWTPSYQTATRTFHLTATDNTHKIDSTESETFTFQAVTPAASGATTFAATSWGSINRPSNGSNGSSNSTVTIGSVAQAITFNPPTTKTYGDPDFVVSATGGASGNPVTFTLGAGSTCSIADHGDSTATVHITGAGDCTINADQAAGSGYTSAPQVSRTISIAQAAQTITLDGIDTQTYAPGATVPVVVSASSGLAVDLGVTGDCSLAGTTITLTGAGSCTVTANQAGNADYLAAGQQQVTFSINKADASVALNLSDLSATYDGNPHAVSAPTTPDGLSGVTVTYDGSTTPPTDAGSYDVVASLDNPDYAADDATGTLVISPKEVTGTCTVAGRVYDATTDATITGCTIPSGVVDGDEVSVDHSGATASFDSKNVGTRTATITGTTLAGADAANYHLTVGTASADITPATVTASIQAGDKTYDGTTDATAIASLDGVIGSDDVTAHVSSASFDTKDVGGDETVTATISLNGGDAGNYVLASDTVTDTANISALSITASFTADNKVYDATTAATIHPTRTGVLDGDTVTITGTGSFGDKNVANGKTVTSTDLALGGSDAGNYDIGLGPWTSTANITPKGVTASITADNKVWDGTAAATIHPTLSGGIAGDDLSVSGTGTFGGTSVGTWTVTSTDLALGGGDAANYNLAAGPWTTSAKITPAYSGTGFYQPVDMSGVLNKVKGGQTVPLKFNEKDATGVNQTALSIFPANAFSVSTVACNTTAPVDAVEVTTTGSTSLRYDTTGGQYIQNWKTPSTVGCYAVKVTTVDGSTVGPAYFQ